MSIIVYTLLVYSYTIVMWPHFIFIFFFAALGPVNTDIAITDITVLLSDNQ